MTVSGLETSLHFRSDCCLCLTAGPALLALPQLFEVQRARPGPGLPHTVSMGTVPTPSTPPDPLVSILTGRCRIVPHCI